MYFKFELDSASSIEINDRMPSQSRSSKDAVELLQVQRSRRGQKMGEGGRLSGQSGQLCAHLAARYR